MALARTSVYAADINNAFVTGSFTPPANSLLVVSIFALDQPTNIAGGTTLSGGGLTFTQRGPTLVPDSNGLGGGYSSLQQIFTAPVGGSPSSMTITVSGFDGNCQWVAHVVAYTGYDTGSPIGATGSFTAPYNTKGINDSASLTLSAAPASSSFVFASMAAGANSNAGPVTVGTGWTEIYDWVGANVAGLGFQSQERTGSTSTTVGWDDVDTSNGSAGLWGCSGIAIEIVASSAGTSITIPQGNLVLSPTAPSIGISLPQGNLALSSVAPVVVVAALTSFVSPIQSPPIWYQIKQPFFIPASNIFTTVDLAIPQGNLALSPTPPVLDYNITVPQGNLALSPTAPVIVRSIPQGNLALSPTAPSLGLGLTPSQGNLVLSSTAPSIGISVPQGNLVLSGTAPDVQAGAGVAKTPSQGNLVLSPTAPNVVQSISQGNLVLSPTAPTSVVDTKRIPLQGNLALSSAAPNVVQSISQGNLVLSSTAPSLGISTLQGNLALSSVAPLASVGVTRQPPASDLALSSVAPKVVQSVSAGNLVLSTTSPSIGISVPQGNLVLSPTASSVVQSISQGNLVLSPTAPTVAQTFHRNITVPQGDLALSPTAPQVGGAISRLPLQGNIVLSGTAPIVARTAHVFANPAARDLLLSEVAPTCFNSDIHPVTVPRGDLLLSTLPAQLIPGVYEYPIASNLFLTTSAPGIAVVRLHHWRRVISLLGKLNGHSITGNVKQKPSLKGTIDHDKTLG